jgi:hypothetical protein
MPTQLIPGTRITYDPALVAAKVHPACGYRREALGHLGQCLGQWPAPEPTPVTEAQTAMLALAAEPHTAPAAYPTTAEVRAWAQATGRTVPARGRVPGQLFTEYIDAH